jgi:flavin-binding protein dodecin
LYLLQSRHQPHCDRPESASAPASESVSVFVFSVVFVVIDWPFAFTGRLRYDLDSIPQFGRPQMSIAKITEISSSSTVSFEDAVQQGIARAGKTLKNIKGAWISEHKVDVADNQVTNYRVMMKVSFVLDD